jgi:hypothetical protein
MAPAIIEGEGHHAVIPPEHSIRSSIQGELVVIVSSVCGYTLDRGNGPVFHGPSDPPVELDGWSTVKAQPLPPINPLEEAI